MSDSEREREKALSEFKTKVVHPLSYPSIYFSIQGFYNLIKGVLVLIFYSLCSFLSTENGMQN